MRIYRIGTADFPIWSGAGAATQGGRWNLPGSEMIYTAGSLSLAMLERPAQRRRFREASCVEALVPDDVP